MGVATRIKVLLWVGGAVLAIAAIGGLATLAINASGGTNPSSSFTMPPVTRVPLVSPTPLSPSTPTGTATAPPQQTTVDLSSVTWNPDSGSFDGWALLPYVIDTDGTCTLTLTSPSGEKTVAVGAAYADARLTYCDLLRIPGDAVSGESWTAAVTYSSPAYAGESNTLEVTR